MPILPQTTAQLSHALVIQAGGENIGAINEWSVQQNRTLTDLYEFGPVNTRYAEISGEPFEVVPGNVGGQTIQLRRWDLYVKPYERAFGAFDLTMLTRQDSAIDLREVWKSPGNANDYAILLRGCWFENVGRQLSATGDRTINTGGSVRYTRKDRANV